MSQKRDLHSVAPISKLKAMHYVYVHGLLMNRLGTIFTSSLFVRETLKLFVGTSE